MSGPRPEAPPFQPKRPRRSRERVVCGGDGARLVAGAATLAAWSSTPAAGDVSSLEITEATGEQ
jgi:hypothetical protein